MSKLTLKIVTPERVVYEDVVDSLSVMTEIGQVTILKNHIPLVSLLHAGELTLRDGSNISHLAVSTGVLEVRPGNNIIILADSAERSDELNLEEIEKAKQLAEKRLKEARNHSDIAYADAMVQMERELARHKVASKKYRNVGKPRP